MKFMPSTLVEVVQSPPVTIMSSVSHFQESGGNSLNVSFIVQHEKVAEIYYIIYRANKSLQSQNEKVRGKTWFQFKQRLFGFLDHLVK